MKFRFFVLAILLTGIGAFLFSGAKPALAHAQLQSTNPANGASLTEAPSNVSIYFGEPVELSLGGVRVYNSAGQRVDTGSPRHIDEDKRTIIQSLKQIVPGGYVATWRVVSSDSHPVQGAITFQVGSAESGDLAALSKRLLAAEGGEESVGAAFTVVRATIFSSVALVVGGCFFLLWGSIPTDRIKVFVRLMVIAGTVGLMATGFSVVLQGAYASGLSLIDALSGDVINSVLETRYGFAALLRVILFAVILLLLIKFSVARWRVAVLVAVSIGIVISIAIAGHAISGRWVALALSLDVIHVASMSLWLGGLVAVALLFLRKLDAESAASTVRKFSRIALYAIGVLIVTGSIQGWRQLGSLDALTSTDYGGLLIVKVAIVAGLIIIAIQSRKVVNRWSANSPSTSVAPTTIKRLRLTVVIETVLAVGILIATSLLVNATPGRAQVTEPFATNITMDNLLVQVLFDPALTGPNQIHVYTLTQEGAIVDVPEVKLTMSMPSKEITALSVPLLPAGPGHVLAQGFPIPIKGDWKTEIQVRTSDVDVENAIITVPIR